MHGIRTPRILRRQHGAALATALFFLVILTILGLAAMRSGRLGLKLSQNENDRMTAQQNAQTAVDVVRSNPDAFLVLPGSDYLQSCIRGDYLDAAKLSTQQGYTCPSPAAVPNQPAITDLLPFTTPLPSNIVYSKYWYISVRREQANGADYLPVTALRQGDSSDRYNLAWFTVVGGYDRVALSDSSAAAQGGSEIAQGVYVKVAKIKGLTQQ